MPRDKSGCPQVISGFGGEIYRWEILQHRGTWMFSCELLFNVFFVNAVLI